MITKVEDLPPLRPSDQWKEPPLLYLPLRYWWFDFDDNLVPILNSSYPQSLFEWKFGNEPELIWFGQTNTFRNSTLLHIKDGSFVRALRKKANNVLKIAEQIPHIYLLSMTCKLINYPKKNMHSKQQQLAFGVGVKKAKSIRICLLRNSQKLLFAMSVKYWEMAYSLILRWNLWDDQFDTQWMNLYGDCNTKGDKWTKNEGISAGCN